MFAEAWLWLLERPALEWTGIGLLGLGLLYVLHLHDRSCRDPQRLFSFDQKRALRAQALGRCEHKPLIGPRCRRRGTQADHVVPWSKGGPTQLWNGQLLCQRYNLAKSNLMPSRFYRWRLARRRRRY